MAKIFSFCPEHEQIPNCWNSPPPLPGFNRCKQYPDIEEYGRDLALRARGDGISRLPCSAVPVYFFEYQPCSPLSSWNDSWRGL